MCVRWNWWPTHPTGRLCRSDLNWIRALTRVPTSSEYPNYHPGVSNTNPVSGKSDGTTAVQITPHLPKPFSTLPWYLNIWSQLPQCQYIWRSQPNSLSQRLTQQTSLRRSRVFVRWRSLEHAFVLVTYLIYTCNTSVLQACIKYVTICHNRYTLITYLSKPRPCICLDSSHKNSLTSYDVVVSQIKIWQEA